MRFSTSMHAINATLGFSVLALSTALAQTTTTTTTTTATAPLIPFAPPSVSTVPTNGDVNPYGVAFAPTGLPTGGVLQPGDILVSNFNNSGNMQGTGSTITRVTSNGTASTFFQSPTVMGLTGALGIVRHGFVFVGSLPTTDGTSATVGAGTLLMMTTNGVVVASVTNPAMINGPWGMAVHDTGSEAQIFVSNVLNGTVMRFDLSFFKNSTTILTREVVQVGGGYSHRLDPNALVLGPSGLAYDAANDILYVASSSDNAVYAIPNAGSVQSYTGMGTMVYQDTTHLHGPLDLVLAPNGDLIVANSDGSNEVATAPSEIVEFTTAGKFVSQFSVDPANGGAFGIALINVGGAVRFAAVDDNQNTLNTWTTPIP